MAVIQLHFQPIPSVEPGQLNMHDIVDLNGAISYFGGNAVSISIILWSILRFRINRLDLFRIIIGVALTYLLAISLGVILISLTLVVVPNPDESLPLTMFVSALTEELMKCSLYILFFRGIYRVQTIIIFGLVFGVVEIILANVPLSFSNMISTNLHFFLHPSFLLILFYIANKSAFKNSKSVILGITVACIAHILNNCLAEYLSWLYPYFFSALMILSYSVLRNELKYPISETNTRST